AEERYRACLLIREKNQPDDWSTFYTKSLLGAALLAQKNYADAEPLLLAGFEGLKKRHAKIPLTHKARLSDAVSRLGQHYKSWGKKDKVEQWQKEADAMKSLVQSMK